jgi:uncharacterized membrane protein YqiK
VDTSSDADMAMAMELQVKCFPVRRADRSKRRRFGSPAGSRRLTLAPRVNVRAGRCQAQFEEEERRARADRAAEAERQRRAKMQQQAAARQLAEQQARERAAAAAARKKKEESSCVVA